MIRIKELSKSFGEKKVLSNFNAEFESSKINVIMGESGCGKTTLINLIMGLENLDGGEITGVPDKIAAVFQEDCLCDDFSAVSNLRAVLGRKKAKEYIPLLISFGLNEDDIVRPVSRLSGGMKRRVAIARALAAPSDLIIMDEPFKGLDEETKTKVANIVENETRNAKKTLILITHSAHEIGLLHADNILYM